MSSDGGTLLLRAVGQHIGLMPCLSACFTDHRKLTAPSMPSSACSISLLATRTSATSAACSHPLWATKTRVS